MRRSPRPLGSAFDHLEDRSLPTAFGIPWADPGHVSLSFTPDATPTPRGPSSLGPTLGAAGPTAAWQREVLRGFQSWAAVTNINVGLVRDGGQPLGTAGAVQGDARFGDVRVAAAPLAGGAVASALPFSWTGTTFSGDVLFNSGSTFGIGNRADAFDVYSIALHEAGHAFGLAHDDGGSAMDEGYAYRTGLGAEDVAAIRALYGVRDPDAYDAAGGNDTTSRASAMKASGLTGRVVADGDLTTTADVDFYKFSTLPTLGLTSVTVRLQAAGLSLLTPRVTVYNAAGRVVASGVTADPLNNDLTVRFANPLFGGTFYAKVEGAADDVFGIGAYRLTVDTLDLTVPIPLVSSLLAPVVGGLNDTLATATDLTRTAPTDARFDATFRAAIESRSDVDTYKLRAPAGSDPVSLNVLVWGTDAAPLAPRVRVYDAAGGPVAFQVLANDTGVFSVEVQGATPGATYYVAVSARTPDGANATGSYFVGADFNQFAPTTYTTAATGTVDAGTPAAGALAVTRAGVFQFALAADALGGAGGTLTMTVTDAAGKVVLALESATGRPLTAAVRYLAEGTYTVRYTTRGSGTLPPGPVGYGLFLLKLSDDVGPYGSNTTSQPPPPSSGSTSSYPSSYPPSSYPPPSPPPADSSGSPDSGTYSSPYAYSYYSYGYTYDGSSGTYSAGTPYYY